ncbi:hypothetical protein CA233_00640 [Sphingomonas sp. ABOLD]|uniref:L,D-TPase catalytic domain-containing protein n=1 Tax=Sphingomonas trueperi TaxID=53317 RepID=A0A7X5XYH4_9SPHN|nr:MULTISPECIES: hypothetical protein [Sphingomonas]NJB97718.1 hypothetical protein [Sphingomonas trueperi]RSV52916.1 hypothetical protein CA233_00640 [Sphingomonas sp. ABOLD]
MIQGLLALAGLALLVPPAAAVPLQDAKPKAAAPKKAAPKKGKRAAAAKPKAAAAKPAAPRLQPSAATLRVHDWVSSAGDNHGLPYLIVDKPGAALFLYDAHGKQLAAVPVLIGIAPGDDATPGIGAKQLSEIGPAEKTTPAGRYLAKFGLAIGKERVLWVDYYTSVALHPVPTGAAARKEKRRERLASPTPDDNRITFGCINVPSSFYAKLLSPMYKGKGGYVYVLPDSKPIEAVFPALHVRSAAAR